MAVIALLLSVVTVAFWLPGGNAACPSFNINYPTMRTLLCPGDNITYTCAVSSTLYIVNTLWAGSRFSCPSNNPANTIQLSQVGNTSLNTVPVSCGNLSAVMTNISRTCYTSVLTIPTPQYFNGTTVMCKDGSTNTVIDSDTLNIQLASPPSPPNITVSGDLSKTFEVTFTSVPTATSYNVSINDSTPISLPPDTTIIVTIGNNNIMVSIPSNGAISYVLNLINRINSSVYTVSVVAINCAGSSSPAKMTAMLSAASSPSVSSSIAGSTQSLVSVLMSTNEPASTNLPSQSMPTTQSSSSNSDAVPIGVGVGIVVLLLLVAIAVVLVVFIVMKNKVSPATPKGDNNKRNEGDNYEKNKVPALPPKNTPSKPEGLIYADIGLASRVPMQAPNPPELSDVTYSTVQHVL